MKITVYSKPSCVACNQTYRALDKMGVDYQIVDMSKDEMAFDKIRGLGFSSAPVVDAGENNMWAGFRPDKLDTLTAVAAAS